MRIRIFFLVLMAFASQQLQAQFMEYKPLPILIPNQYLFPAQPNQLSVEEQYLRDKKRRLELDVLREQRDLLRNLNGNSSGNTNPADLITLSLIGASTSDMEFKPKSDWKAFTRSSFLVINKTKNQGRLILPEFNQDLTFDVLDVKVHQGEGYSINTLELDSNNFISVLNVFKESGLWILWGTKGEQELIIFQSEK